MLGDRVLAAIKQSSINKYISSLRQHGHYHLQREWRLLLSLSSPCWEACVAEEEQWVLDRSDPDW